MFATATATAIVTATAAATATATAAVTRLLLNRSHRYPLSCHRFYGSSRDHPPDIPVFIKHSPRQLMIALTVSLSFPPPLSLSHTRARARSFHPCTPIPLSYQTHQTHFLFLFLCVILPIFNTHVISMFRGGRRIRCIWQRTPCGGAVPQSRQGRTKPLRHEALLFDLGNAAHCPHLSANGFLLHSFGIFS